MRKQLFNLIIVIFLISCGEVAKQYSSPIQTESTPIVQSTIDSAVTEPVPIRITTADFVGKWDITMELTETTCEGSQVGDFKKETWNISKSNGQIIVKVSDNDKTNDEYIGSFEDGKIKLHATSTDGLFNGDINVSGEQTNASSFTAEREIIIDKPCKIVYRITGEKKD